MRTILLSFIASCALAAASLTALHAQPVEPGAEGELANFLSPRPSDRTCYARSYSDQHLQSHPEQKVTDMEFLLTYYAHEPDEYYRQGQRNYYFKLRAKLRGTKDWYEAFGECVPTEGAIFCGVDCDGGGIAVKRRDGDKVLVHFDELGRIRMAGCDGAPEGEGIELTPGTDDKEFLLDRISSGECPAYDDW